MWSRTAKTVQAVSSFYVKTAANRQWCIRNINAVKSRKNKSCPPTVNDPVCAEWLGSIIFRATHWSPCSKKSSRATQCQWKPVTCRTWRYSWIGRSLVVCLRKNGKILALDCPVPKNTTDCGICHRWSQCFDLPTLMEQDSKSVSCLSHL
mgnify:CR=1 FL=1